MLRRCRGERADGARDHFPRGCGSSSLRDVRGASQGAAACQVQLVQANPDAACPSDHFADLGLFAIYDKAGHLEAIELAPHAAKDPKLPSESVLVFAPGYYD